MEVLPKEKPDPSSRADKSGEEEITKIIEGLRNGRVSAYEKVVKRFARPILNFIYRTIGNIHEAEDLTQEVFLAVHQYFHSYQEKYKLSTWLFTIAHRKAVKFLQQRRDFPIPVDNETLHKLKSQGDGRHAPPPGMADSSENENTGMMDQALDLLPVRYRQIFILHYLEEQSNKEVSDVLGISEGIVRMKLYRARRYLRKKLETVRK